MSVPDITNLGLGELSLHYRNYCQISLYMYTEDSYQYYCFSIGAAVASAFRPTRR